MWLYGSGFPKSMNIGIAIDKKNGVESKIVGYADTTMPDFRDVGKKQKEISGIDKLTFGQIENSERKKTPIYEAQNKWKGWGSCLKPAFEPIIVARKPFKGSLVDNVIKWGVGGLNINECRVPLESDYEYKETNRKPRTENTVFDNNHSGFKSENNNTAVANPEGRFPANLILTYNQLTFDDVCGGFPNTKSQKTDSKLLDIRGNNYNNANKNLDIAYERGYSDSGSASRYFYCAKASKKDRDEGLDKFEEKNTMCDRNPKLASANMPQNRSGNLRKNTHPTVKPTELMQYLIRLVTPNGGVILDPFMGSGSTGKAVIYENRERNKNYDFIGIEKEEEYYNIAKARIENI